MAKANMIRAIIISLAFQAIVCDETTTPSEPTEEDSTTLAAELDDEITVSDILGNSTESRQTRGYNGRQVAIDKYPFVVSFYDGQGQFSCTGTIVTSSLILTAHHCVTPPRIPYNIKVGSRDIYSGGTFYPIKNIIHYPGADVYHHDIAMLLLGKRIQNGYQVRLLGAGHAVPPGTKLQGVGWGQTRQGPIRYLEEVDIWSVDHRDCARYYQPSKVWICTHTHRSATCIGDSGGPVMYNGYQLGIISHSQAQHCGSDFPTANAFVPSYLSWINTQIHQYG